MRIVKKFSATNFEKEKVTETRKLMTEHMDKTNWPEIRKLSLEHILC